MGEGRTPTAVPGEEPGTTDKRKQMKCDRARELLWPPERPRVADDEVVAARRHVDGCPACQDFLSMDHHLRDRLRNLPRPQAPPEVRERVFEALARERARGRKDADRRVRSGSAPHPEPASSPARGPYPLPFRSPLFQALGMAAALAGLFLGGWYLVERAGVMSGPADTPAAREAPPVGADEVQFVEAFVRGAVPDDRITSSDPEAVSAFLERELGMSLEPLAFEGFRLMGAEVCVLDGKRGAVLSYERNGQVLYHFVIEHDEVTASPPTPSAATPHRWSGSTPPAVVIWSAGARDEALVGDVPGDGLLAMAEAAYGRP
jgi:anti-sigma factor RsiW